VTASTALPVARTQEAGTVTVSRVEDLAAGIAGMAASLKPGTARTVRE
jgi:hypothetical protein